MSELTRSLLESVCKGLTQSICILDFKENIKDGEGGGGGGGVGVL